jgi:C-terminal processing protease CtpA/Prc
MRWGSVVVALAVGAPVLGGTAAGQEPAPVQPENQVVGRLVPFGRIDILTSRRARLGVTVNMQARETDSLGAYINGVTPNGPAARAGIRSGDIITRFNGEPLVGRDLKVGEEQSPPGVALSFMAAALSAGDTVTLEYLRGKNRRTVTFAAGDEPAFIWSVPTPEMPPGAFGNGMGPDFSERPLPRRRDSGFREREHMRVFTGPGVRLMMLDSPLGDLELAPLNPELGRYFGASKGVLVISVPEDSRLGLKPGDVVFSVDGRAVTRPPQLLRALQSYEPDETFRLEIMRMKKKETVRGSVGQE